MRFECPACQRSFDEAGFCPYDGKPLVGADHPTIPASDHPTIPSGTVPAQSDHPTLPSGNVPTQRAPTDDSTKIRALSATEGGAAEVKAALREKIGQYDHLIGETLDGRYVVLRKLGEGGMGVVFAVKHAVIERPLAIKVLKREATRDVSTARRFVQEAKAASRIGHPNIVDVTDFGTTPDGLTYSVMELVDGPTLKKVIRAAAPFTPARAVHIAAQLARGLAAAHDKRIIHRDLKPDNVFLIDRDGRPDFVKIVDFGIARVQPLDSTSAEPRLTRAGSIVGTPEYMAPEQASGRTDTDHRVDVYALGTILYEMLVGKVPHKDRSMVRTIAMQMLEPITPPSQVRPDLAIPPQLEAIVMKALAKNRDERYATMAQLHAALEAIAPQLAGLTAQVTAPSVTIDAATTPDGAPRRARPATRKLHEPEFVAGPLKLLAPEEGDAPVDSPPSRLPWVLAALAVASVGAAIALIVTRGNDRDERSAVAAAPRDAAVAPALADAAAPALDEFAVNLPLDAASAPASALDAGARQIAAARDGGATTTSGHPALVTIEILTSPGETNVFVGNTYRGPSGTNMTEAYGTHLTIECRAPHFKGTKQVVFDGKVSSVLCTATRLPFCVPELHNPLDDCEPRGDSDANEAVVKPGP